MIGYPLSMPSASMLPQRFEFIERLEI